MNFIVAVDKNWSIGCQGSLLEWIPEDLKQFKAKTINNVVVMGRKTLESLPGKKPLPNRTNIVLTRQANFACEGAIICNSYEELANELQNFSNERIFIIGGGEIYNKMIPFSNMGFVTKLHKEYNADTSIINLDLEESWSVIKKEGPFNYRDDIYYSYWTYKNNNVLSFK